MSRPRGGYIGYNPAPAASALNSAAGGIWTLREAEALKRAGTWPIATFTPDLLSGLQLWLDASDSSTLYDATTGGSLVAADGGVARWEDKSGNARHVTQATAGSRPLRKASVQNGRDGLRFDGSDDVMTVSGSASSLKALHAEDATFFVVLKAGTTSDPDALYNILDTNAGSNSRVGFRIAYEDRSIASANDRINFWVTAGSGVTVSDNFSDDFFAPNVYGLVSVVSRPTDGTAANKSSIRKNGGTSVENNTGTGSVSTADSTYDLHLGGRGTNSGYLTGDICEIIIYNSALSDTDRKAVENYLMTKWGIEPAPVPQQISGLQAWYDASDASTLYDATSGGSLVAADGAVARWEDKSGNGRHATQGTAGSRPVRKASVQNGLDVMRFDGTDDALLSSYNMTGSTDLTLFAVTKNLAASGTATAVSNYDLVSGATRGILLSLSATAGANLAGRPTSGSGSYLSASSGTDDFDFNLVTGKFSSSNSIRSYLNGVAGSSVAVPTGTIAGRTDTGIGWNTNAGGIFYNQDICEIIIYNSALSDTDREAVESYLMTKWGIS